MISSIFFRIEDAIIAYGVGLNEPIGKLAVFYGVRAKQLFVRTFGNTNEVMV